MSNCPTTGIPARFCTCLKCKEPPAAVKAGIVRERPILFSAAMIRAILDDRKTQTRRVVKLNDAGRVKLGGKQWHIDDPAVASGCPYGVAGDRLWVKETWQHAQQDRCSCPQPSEPSPCDDWMNGTGCRSNRGEVIYRADVCNEAEERAVVRLARQHGTRVTPWRPSIFMSRWASRISLEITGIRVERLQDISETDSIAEGVQTLGRDIGRPAPTDAAKLRYAALWGQINGTGSWAANPWVWVVSFRRLPA